MQADDRIDIDEASAIRTLISLIRQIAQWQPATDPAKSVDGLYDLISMGVALVAVAEAIAAQGRERITLSPESFGRATGKGVEGESNGGEPSIVPQEMGDRDSGTAVDGGAGKQGAIDYHNPPPFLSIHEAASLLGVSYGRVTGLCNKRELRSVKWDRNRLVVKADVELLASRQRQESKGKS